MTQNEAEVLRRWDAGQSRQRIARDSGIHPTVVNRALSYASERETGAMLADLHAGSASLLGALQREGMAA